MESKEELISNLKEREEYLEGEWYQLIDIAEMMGGLESLKKCDSPDSKDIVTALTATYKALRAIKRVISRNK